MSNTEYTIPKDINDSIEKHLISRRFYVRFGPYNNRILLDSPKSHTLFDFNYGYSISQDGDRSLDKVMSYDVTEDIDDENILIKLIGSMGEVQTIFAKNILRDSYYLAGYSLFKALQMLIKADIFKMFACCTLIIDSFEYPKGYMDKLGADSDWLYIFMHNLNADPTTKKARRYRQKPEFNWKNLIYTSTSNCHYVNEMPALFSAKLELEIKDELNKAFIDEEISREIFDLLEKTLLHLSTTPEGNARYYSDD